MKGLRKRILGGETVLGCWLNLGSAITAEIVGTAGFDWVLVDLEHGAGGEREALAAMQALAGTPAAAVVRVETHARQRVHRILDMGAEGVMFPRIGNPGEAREAVEAMRYPPEGVRGVARNIRVAEFGAAFDDYYAHYKERQVGILQIENEEVLGHLDAIAAMDGVDVLFVGPSDLTMALGAFGDKKHPKYQEAIRRVAEAARRVGKAAGVLLGPPEEFGMYFELGYRFIACGSDGGILATGTRGLATTLRKQVK